jgi:hypothetical protein
VGSKSDAAITRGSRPAASPSTGLLLKDEFDLPGGLWEMCNSRGSHAGRSDEEEARLRLLAISAYARFLLSQLG